MLETILLVFTLISIFYHFDGNTVYRLCFGLIAARSAHSLLSLEIKMSRVFLIDTDTASDDAVALIMALKAPEVRVAAITVVAGNVGVDQACRNALYTAELCGSNVPVFRGAESPLTRKLEDASWFHGLDGMGDHGYPAAQRPLEKLNAVDAIIEVAQKNPGLVLITLGPLTNIALALQRKPDLGRLISRCVVMGGAPCCEGNVTPAAEFNIWCDPEAAHQVMHGSLPLEMIGWQLCRGSAALTLAEIAKVNAFNTPLARFAIECNSTAQAAYLEQTGEYGISLPDPVAMSIALDRSIGIAWGAYYVDVETTGTLTRGMTVVDRLGVATNARNRSVWDKLVQAPPNVTVCWSLDVAKWKANLFAALNS
jgi:purine nucleosidase